MNRKCCVILLFVAFIALVGKSHAVNAAVLNAGDFSWANANSVNQASYLNATSSYTINTSSMESTTIISNNSNSTLNASKKTFFGIPITNCSAYYINGTNSTVVQENITYNGTNASAIAISVPGLTKNVTVDLSSLAFGSAFGAIATFIILHRYYSLFLLMALEQSSVPIPSEVVATTAGYLASKCLFSFTFAFLALTAGGMLGIAVDYYIGYYFGREFLYRHMRLFHLKKDQIIGLEEWFRRNGPFAVFATRLLPVVRTIMSFPAGFTRMSKAKFFGYSFLGLSIWNVSLMLFGYFLLGAANITLISIAVVAAMIVLYLAYRIIINSVRKGAKR